MGGVFEYLLRGRFTITDEFPIRPSWCDAKLSLIQIKNGKAKGNRIALIVRSYLQTFLFALGSFIQNFDWACVIVLLLIFGAWAIPLRHIELETNIEKLWVPKGGRLEAEREFTNYVNTIKRSGGQPPAHAPPPGAPAVNQTARPTPPAAAQPSGDTSSTSELAGLQVLIQTTRHDHENILTKEQLLLHAEVLLYLSQMSVDLFGANWTMEDICFKPSFPIPKGGGTADVIGGALQSLIPCVMITPLDCFWEGSIPRGPFPPHDTLAGIIPISWQTLDPQEALNMINAYKSILSDGDFDTGDIVDMFQRAGIQHAYQRLPCVDPLNKKCPKLSPNKVDVCDLVQKFLDWNDHHFEYPNFTRIITTTKKPVTHNPDYDSVYGIEDEHTGHNSSTSSNGGSGGLLGGDAPPEHPECISYAEKIAHLLYRNETLQNMFLPQKNETWSGYGKYLTGGCKGFAPKFMSWPEQLIIGGRVPKNRNETIEKISALQTVIMLATADDIFARFAGVNQTAKPGLNFWNLDAARYVVTTWQRRYSKIIFDWPHNKQADGIRILHPLAAASVTDMVEEFSHFNWSFIFIGYGLMIAYACFSALSFARRGVRSCLGLAFAGCMIVILANVSGLGCTLLFGISFNATTTQILPFLLLSLGVDEMFLLLDKYREIMRKIKHDEIGVLLRETGLSVLVTYINNIIAFFAGVMLPIPALKVFCVQVAIVLIFNLIAILTIYPAVMALDLRRQRSNRVDVLCCIRWPNATADGAPRITPTPTYGAAVNGDNVYELEKKSAVKNGVAAAHQPTAPVQKKAAYKRFTLTHFVRDCYAPWIQKLWVKICLCMIFVAFFVAAMVGIFRIPIGLELSELIPKESPPYSFMVAREKYFSFYNIFMAMRGPNIDYSNLKTQRLMREYVENIRNIDYTVNTELKSDWISMMTDWLKHLEKRFQNDWENGAISLNKWDPEEATKAGIIGYKLLCNKYGKVDCSKVDGNSTMFRDDGLLEPQLFNKSVTAWFNSDSMTYYVSQAAFHPTPEPWEAKNKSFEIPNAPALIYCQIPLFIDGVVDTPATMDMIIKFRNVADNYSGQGLPNFPLGIPFTFWELYIYLTDSIIKALGIITAAVFVCISLMLLNPWISALIVIVLIFMIIIELGFMGLIYIKLNPISAVTLITAVGIRVKFTVHVALSFLTTVGTRNIRVARTLEHMFIPVLHGGVSTLLGLIMLGFTKFEFIVMYYFLIMFALVVLGILGGLILMPVLLSWIGPPAEVIPLDGKDYLDPPVQADIPSSLSQSSASPVRVTSLP